MSGPRTLRRPRRAIRGRRFLRTGFPRCGCEAAVRPDEKAPKIGEKPRRRSRWRTVGKVFLVLAVLLVAARIALPHFVRDYVIRTLDQSPLYDGRIGDVSIHLWRGAY